MSKVVDLLIPDIGDAEEVEVIEILRTTGEVLSIGDVVLTVESDKAAMDIPCEQSGRVVEVLMVVGEKVKQGQPFAKIEIAASVDVGKGHSDAALSSPSQMNPALASARSVCSSKGVPAREHANPAIESVTSRCAPAGPASRRLARELGVDIIEVEGTGRRGRILKEDVKKYAKSLLMASADKASVSSPAFSELPDISKFGATHSEGLSKIEQVTSRNMQRAWREIPHAWLQRRVDITALDLGRQRLKEGHPNIGLMALIIKANVLTLQRFPRFNSVLDVQSQHIIYRDYIHIGVAVDTPRGLIIAVIRDCDKLTIAAIGTELSRLSSLAREGKLHVSEMRGAGMTVSSLGGFGVDGLQPIVNWPEVAILGVASARMQPIFNGDIFEPRLMLPMTLGFDHRVINGADGARFLAYLEDLLSDPMRLLIDRRKG